MKYQNFTVISYPNGVGHTVCRWFRSESPIPWLEARDRLIAAGILKAELAGRTSTREGWLLSVDPANFVGANAEPLPAHSEDVVQ